MPCPLCREDRPLRESHIIPESMYKPGYDKKHRLIKINKNQPQTGFEQKGLRERLLCGVCEGDLNDRYERWFPRFWRKVLPSAIVSDDLYLTDVDYPRFKLFHLSILWRASVSKSFAFRRVVLGATHESRIREMLLKEEAGPDSEYQILGSVIIRPDTRAPIWGAVMTPIRRRVDGRRIYTFLYGGCAWHFVVSNHPIRGLRDDALSTVGTLRMPVLDMSQFPPVDGFMRDHFDARRQAGLGRLET